MLSAAIPQFVSLLLMRTMLKDNGLINNLLVQAGLISSPLPFLTNATWARATVVIINLWVGIPFTMMQVTGILQNIPGELYEAARVDGAGPVTIFFKITLPYMLFVTTPYLITTFTGNINNFNVIYLLTAGAPVPVGATAGKTDLLVTWLYKLTVDLQYFNVGAVVGILTFVIPGGSFTDHVPEYWFLQERGGIPIMNNKEKKTHSWKARGMISDVVVHVVLALLAIVWVIPVLWIALLSFSTQKGSYVTSFFPKGYTLHNYVRLFTDTQVLDFPQMFKNTFIIAVFSCLISTVFVLFGFLLYVENAF